MTCWKADSACLQAQKLLGWAPEVALRDGLACMIEDFAARLNVPVPKHFQVCHLLSHSSLKYLH